MLGDFNLVMKGVVKTDANAALGMVYRQGLGKTRHVEVQYLWIQQEVLHNRLAVSKVSTNKNPADLMTKALKPEVIQRHLDAADIRLSATRASTAPGLHRVAQSTEREADGWLKPSESTRWARAHRKSRTTLFTPMKVANGPSNAGQIGDIRATNGEYLDGEKFVITDRWRTCNDPHAMMARAWTGTTTFVYS